nr:interferon gamma receptor 1-like [Misgurnus anguillicaudatus]
MSNHPTLSCWLFIVLLYGGVCSVPSPTNISVVCHNFVNVLYWNYSTTPTEEVRFNVKIKPYTGLLQTVDTSEMYLDMSEYTSDVNDNYFVTVKALDGQEVSIKFTYSRSMSDESTHKCYVDFPPIETSVHKDKMNVSFSHPYNIYNYESLNEVFTYRVTHDERETSFDCYDDEELCTAEIHIGQSEMGKCIDLTFEATVDVLFSTFNKNVCLPKMPNVPDKPIYIAALVGGGVVILFIVLGFVWLLCKKWSSIPKIPEVLINFMTPNKPVSVIHQPLETTVSPVSPASHLPLLQTENTIGFEVPIVSPPEKDPSFTLHDTEVVMDPETSCTSERDENYESEESDYGKSSDYDSPKFLQEMSPGDFATGYGPRPSVL